MQLEALAADLEHDLVAIGLVRISILGGPADAGEAELPDVDQGVVAGGEDVAIEPGWHRLVRDQPSRRAFGFEVPDAEDVIDVPVRVDRRVQRRTGPSADRLMDVARH